MPICLFVNSVSNMVEAQSSSAMAFLFHTYILSAADLHDGSYVHCLLVFVIYFEIVFFVCMSTQRSTQKSIRMKLYI